MESFKDFKEIVRETIELTLDKLEWKPLYPNNMPNNGQDGWYCMLLHRDSDGFVVGRKYTIKFQYKEITEGEGLIDRTKVDRYVLFEKNYFNVKGPTQHPEPSNDFIWHTESDKTLHAAEVNDCGSFIYAYENLEAAKKRALKQYKAIYGYALAHLI